MLRLAAVVAALAVASAAPCRAQASRVACATCHVANDGGPLTETGREYRWRANGVDDELAGYHTGVATRFSSAGGGGGSSGAGESGGANGGGDATAPSGFGRWSGETSFFGRFGRTHQLGKPVPSESAIETLHLHGEGTVGDDSVTFDSDAFARQGHNSFDGGVSDDGVGFSTAQVTWKSAASGAMARLGRQYVAAGAATRRIDGLDVRTPFGESSEVEIFGGVPSDNGFGGVSGDAIGGGRVATRFGESFGIGASAFYSKDASDPSDAKGGFDASWTPVEKLDLLGHVYYDWIADRVYDGRVSATWQPSLEWQLAADWIHSVPALFLPKDSIFWVFSVDAYDESALTVTRRFDERLSGSVYGRHTAYDDGSRLEQAGGSLDARYGPNGEDTVGGEVAWQNEERGSLGGSSVDGDVVFLRGYHQLWWTASVYTALDASIQHLLSSSGRDATLLRAVAGYDPHGSWDFEVGVDWRRDPDFEDEVDLFLRVRIRF
jgi:hypothetical protein